MASFCNGVNACVLVGVPLVVEDVGDALDVGELVDDVEVAGVVGAGAGVGVHADSDDPSTTTTAAATTEDPPAQRIPEPPLPATERVAVTLASTTEAGHPRAAPVDNGPQRSGPSARRSDIP